MELQEVAVLGSETVNIPWYSSEGWENLRTLAVDEIGSHEDYLNTVTRIIDICLENGISHGFVRIDVLELDIWLMDMGLENTGENRARYADEIGGDYMTCPSSIYLH